VFPGDRHAAVAKDDHPLAGHVGGVEMEAPAQGLEGFRLVADLHEGEELVDPVGGEFGRLHRAVDPGGGLGVDAVDDRLVRHPPPPESGRSRTLLQPVPDGGLGIGALQDRQRLLGAFLHPGEGVGGLGLLIQFFRADEFLRSRLDHAADPAEHPALMTGEIGHRPVGTGRDRSLEAGPTGGLHQPSGVVADGVEIGGALHARRLNDLQPPVPLRRTRAAGSWR
jgi:hypothetical protein